MRTLGVVLAVITLALATGGIAQSAPQAVAIQGACSECGATITAIVTINGERVPELAGLPYAIARDRLGRIFVNPRDAEPPIVFDSTGRYLRSLIRSGNGPGEARSAGWLDAGKDDSVRLIAKERMLVFGPDLRFARGVTFFEPFPFWLYSVGMLASNQYLLSYQRCNLQGSCFIEVSSRGADGQTVRGFRTVPGGSPGTVAVRLDSVGYWHVEPLPGDRPGYRIEMHGSDGAAVRRYERESGDFPAQSAPQHVSELRGNRLLVVVNKPKSVQTRGAGAYCACDVTESLVEVIDTRTWRVVTSRTIPSYALRVLDDSHVATYRQTEDGFPLLQVWRIAH